MSGVQASDPVCRVSRHLLEASTPFHSSSDYFRSGRGNTQSPREVTPTPGAAPETTTTEKTSPRPGQTNIKNSGGARETPGIKTKGSAVVLPTVDPGKDLVPRREEIPEPPSMSVGTKVVISLACLAILALGLWLATKAPCCTLAYRRMI